MKMHSKPIPASECSLGFSAAQMSRKMPKTIMLLAILCSLGLPGDEVPDLRGSNAKA